MTARFQVCLTIVLGHEGGYSDVKQDRGGKTNFGVTQKVYDDFCRLTARPLQPVKNITMPEVEAIYSAYWKDAKCGYMPEPLDMLMFDAAVNHGPGRAAKILQRTLGVDDDAVIGKQTLTALHEDVVATSIDDVCHRYLDERAHFFDRIIERDPSQAVFAKGWMNRVDHLRELV